MNNTEVERKFAVSDTDELRTRLTTAGAEKTGTSRQVDTYYNHPARDFLHGYTEGGVISEWLRIREDHSPTGVITASINFKQWVPLGSAAATHADEFESEIADRKTVAAMLEALGFTTMVTVDKHRERWHLHAQTGTVEVAVDRVASLGTFAEFEYTGTGDLDEANSAIDEAVKVANGLLGERDRRGYPYLLLG